MSEPTSESPSPDNSADSTSDSPDNSTGGDDDRLVPDEMLPDDLNPAKNPLAAEPDEDAEAGFSPNSPEAPGA